MPKAPPLRLGVNVDHVATLRNARGSARPDPVRAALTAIEAGADGITAHLREDRRHIVDRDVERLREVLTTFLNLEMAPTEEMLGVALRVRTDAGRSALDGLDGVDEVNDLGNAQEVRWRGDPQGLLLALARRTAVRGWSFQFSPSQ